jgi:hypothetical protein
VSISTGPELESGNTGLDTPHDSLRKTVDWLHIMYSIIRRLLCFFPLFRYQEENDSWHLGYLVYRHVDGYL